MTTAQTTNAPTLAENITSALAFFKAIDKSEVHDSASPLHLLCCNLWNDAPLETRQKILEVGVVGAVASSFSTLFNARLDIVGREGDHIRVAVKSEWAHLTTRQKETFLSGVLQLDVLKSGLEMCVKAGQAGLAKAQRASGETGGADLWSQV